MKVISGLVSAGSGSYGRCTWSRNRMGPYVRERAVPVNPNTVFQQAIRSYLANLAVLWNNTLTIAQKTGWESFALQVPVTDALGNAITLTGLNWYIKANAARLNAGKTRVDAAPSVLTLALLTPVVLTITATTTLSVAYTNTDPWATAVGGHLFLYISRPQSQSINGLKGPYRFFGAVNGAVVPPTSPFIGTSPFPFTTGSRMFLRAQCSNADARPSPDFRTFDDN